MKKTALVIMAAGIGSRFGKGVKQLTSFGPSGEIIMDYSIYDAIEAGFNKVVFVIRKEMEQTFREIIGDRTAKNVEVAYAFQDIQDIPDGFSVPENRVKPWGTGQAILACRDVVHEPFAVINADDYYGKDAYRKVHEYLIRESAPADGRFHFCMAGFVLKNTLSENGGVTRGICKVNSDGSLADIRETKNIIKTPGGAAAPLGDGTFTPLDPDGLVSMNFWGFTPDFMDELAEGFVRFLNSPGCEPVTEEYLLPTIIGHMLKQNRVDLTVLPSSDRWFGVTFQDDIPEVKSSFAKLVAAGAYPESLL